MTYKTVNVQPDTYERLRTYKVAGRSFDEVLNDLMDRIPAETVHEETLRRHDIRIKEMKAGRHATLSELDEALDA